MPSIYYYLLLLIISHGKLAIFIYIMLHVINMDVIIYLFISICYFFNIFVCVILSESGNTHHIILLL